MLNVLNSIKEMFYNALEPVNGDAFKIPLDSFFKKHKKENMKGGVVELKEYCDKLKSQNQLKCEDLFELAIRIFAGTRISPYEREQYCDLMTALKKNFKFKDGACDFLISALRQADPAHKALGYIDYFNKCQLGSINLEVLFISVYAGIKEGSVGIDGSHPVLELLNENRSLNRNIYLQTIVYDHGFKYKDLLLELFTSIKSAGLLDSDTAFNVMTSITISGHNIEYHNLTINYLRKRGWLNKNTILAIAEYLYVKTDFNFPEFNFLEKHGLLDGDIFCAVCKYTFSWDAELIYSAVNILQQLKLDSKANFLALLENSELANDIIKFLDSHGADLFKEKQPLVEKNTKNVFTALGLVAKANLDKVYFSEIFTDLQYSLQKAEMAIYFVNNAPELFTKNISLILNLAKFPEKDLIAYSSLLLFRKLNPSVCVSNEYTPSFFARENFSSRGLENDSNAISLAVNTVLTTAMTWKPKSLLKRVPFELRYTIASYISDPSQSQQNNPEMRQRIVDYNFHYLTKKIHDVIQKILFENHKGHESVSVNLSISEGTSKGTIEITFDNSETAKSFFMDFYKKYNVELDELNCKSDDQPNVISIHKINNIVCFIQTIFTLDFGWKKPEIEIVFTL